MFFEFLPPSERAVDLLLRLVAHAARVKQNQIGALDAVGAFVIHTAHHLCDALGVVLVHLAAVGLQVKLLHGTIKSTIL